MLSATTLKQELELYLRQTRAALTSSSAWRREDSRLFRLRISDGVPTHVGRSGGLRFNRPASRDRAEATLTTGLTSRPRTDAARPAALMLIAALSSAFIFCRHAPQRNTA